MASLVDNAFQRCLLLARILTQARDRALGNPMSDHNTNLGLVQKGQKKQEAITSIETAFEELGALINHLAILHMAASFEMQFRTWLGTAIGEARSAIRDRYKKTVPLYVGRAGLVREQDDFQGLARIEQLLSGRVSDEISEALSLIRENRNEFSHGKDIRIPPTITQQQTLDALHALMEIIVSRES
jgi:hypothetical protein